jgi:excisionase family DNA binding protein
MTTAQTYSELQAIPLDEDAVGELLTVQDAARFLKVSVSWIYEHLRDDATDRLPVLKLGKYLRFDQRDLRAYVDAKGEAEAGKKEFKNGRC